VTIGQVARHLRCSQRHVYELVKTGRLRAVRRTAGAAWRVRAGDLARFLGLPPPASAHAAGDLLTLPDLIRLTGFKDRCLRGEIAQGRLQARRVGRRWLVPVEGYLNWAGLR
jgi:excisionase family DNA binding protein